MECFIFCDKKYQEIVDSTSCNSRENHEDHIEVIRILRNKAHFSLSEGILVPGHNLRKARKIMFKMEVTELSNDS